MNTAAPSPTASVRQHRLAATQTQLIALSAGSELRCLQGQLSLHHLPADPTLSAAYRTPINPHAAWRCPSDGWVSLRTEGPQAACYELHTPPIPVAPLASERAKKNRPGRFDLGRWWLALLRIRPWQRAA
ncbi:hypothetical protein PSQ39_18695 [Curvibacter sp. HBC28]|uniref:Uncharacterized protein n=1 Tax=Curvibacter microcysteis TaxID=3026419 RepID=A0ABT5MN68_9BURK|nr:hypothetical protein [Curvibacter sp. HBC28]MDD0816675.1 hypothetical protein [Curvibacter sp. HBC28]